MASKQRYYSLDERNALSPDNFADPKRRLFVITTQEELNRVPSLIRRRQNLEELKENVLKIAKRKGFEVPEELLIIEPEKIEENLLSDKEFLISQNFKLDFKEKVNKNNKILVSKSNLVNNLLTNDSITESEVKALDSYFHSCLDSSYWFSDKDKQWIEILLAKIKAGEASMPNFEFETKKLTSDGKYVLRSGKIFQAGSYADKKFEISPEEMIDAVNNFKPCDLDLEHTPTILDGKLGKLDHVEVSEDGWSLIGTARIPVWLDDQLGDGDRKVSATWDRATKRLKKLALVRNPRVSDAALMAAFTQDEISKGQSKEDSISNLLSWFAEEGKFAHQTYEGRSTIQQIHDTCSRAGAVCTEPKKENKNKVSYNAEKFATQLAEFISKGESNAIQSLHDIALENGATCSAIGQSYSYYKADETSSGKSNEENKKMKFSDIKKALLGMPDDLEVQNAAGEESGGKVETSVTPPAKPVVDEEKEVLKKQIADYKAKEDTAAEDAKKAAEAALSAKADEETENLKKELETLRNNDIARQAETFASEQIKANRAFPAEKETLVALFIQASKDDFVSQAKVSFKADGKDVEGSRVDALKALYNVRKPHQLTVEELVGLNAGILNASHGDEGDYLKEAAEQAKAYAQLRNGKK